MRISHCRTHHIDENGKAAYVYRYDLVYKYVNGFAIAVKNGKEFHINMDGEKCYPYLYDYVDNVVNKMAIVQKENRIIHIINRDGLWYEI